ncbi:aspartate kinase [Pyrolobus fumarii 1A]|uniref:Aspartokinase n=1 Tax=Pyrolobus fumarii (strain DSM 11204 / 1A) TaxID=694429 RepID=G0EGF1_PYRF1|nr:aspartate kinase [Pyrolobus fumarii]AEM39176.1 aspartate kinase [Pyrolobus fumarii 1A]
MVSRVQGIDGALTVKPLLVAKFGGSVLKSGEDYARAAEITEELQREHSVILVVSAMKGVTDRLLRLARDFEASPSVEIPELYQMHVEALRGAGVSGRLFGEAFSRIARLIDELTKIIWALRVLGEVTPKALDYVVSFGERLSAVIMEAVLRSRGIEAKALTGWEAGIVTDDRFGEANPIMEETVPRVRSRLLPLTEKGIVPIVTGFIAATRKGDITTLGRGGSDYTASLIASILGATEVHFYTDVPGVMTADPRLIPEARTIPRLCVIEALELSRVGGKKFHPRTFEPLLYSKIRARILDAKDPHGPHTIVEPECIDTLKAVAVMRGLAVVRLEGAVMAGRIGTAMMVTSVSKRAGVNIVAISQPVTETRIEIVVAEEDAERLAKALSEEIRNQELDVNVMVETGLSAVTIVGYGLRNPSLRARVLSEALSLEPEPELRSITTGFHDASLTIVTNARDAVRIAERIHSRLLRTRGAGEAS